MIVLALGLPVSQTDECAFVDVEKTSSTGLYPDHYVAACAAHQITWGKMLHNLIDLLTRPPTSGA